MVAALLSAGSADAMQGRRAPTLPIAQGYYVADFEQCGEPMNVFRYDGRRIGWLGRERQANEMEPILGIRRVGARWEVQITDRDPEAYGNSSGRIPVMITARGQNRIAVEVQEEIPMRLCAPASLPRWARR